MTVSDQDKFYHTKSLLLAKMFKELYERLGAEHMLTKLIKEKYIAARKEIAKDDFGERYGHAEAYATLRG